MNEKFCLRTRTARAEANSGEQPMDYDLRKRLLAIEVLLEDPEDITDILESELYALRDKLLVHALGDESGYRANSVARDSRTTVTRICPG
jgi:hypothetical protein